MKTIKDVLIKIAEDYPFDELCPADIEFFDAKIRKQISKITQSSSGALELPPVDFLQKSYIYDEITGKFFKRRADGTLRPLAQNCSSNGYIRLDIKYDGRRFRAAANRVAWAIYYGKAPPKSFVVDHRDGRRANNAIANLQLASHSTNISRSCKIKAPSRGG